MEDTILKVSQVLCDLTDVAELDINPLLADAEGVIALDARPKASGAAQDRLATLPYPVELEQTPVLRDDRKVPARPIRPEDEPGLQRFHQDASENDMRLRFFSQRGVPDHAELARYSQIDYHREMTFVAFDVQDVAQNSLLGYACALSDPDRTEAEFAVQVGATSKGASLATALMRALIGYLRGIGTQTVHGECISENLAMAALTSSLGFSTQRVAGQPQLRLKLQ